MIYAQNEVYVGQPVSFGGRLTVIQKIENGLAFLAGFVKPVRVTLCEPI